MNFDSPLYSTTYSISEDEDSLLMIKKFNKAFTKKGIDMEIDNDFAVIRPYYDPNDYERVNDTFIYPSHRLFYWDGMNKEEFGIRICAIRKKKNGDFKKTIFDMSLRDYKNDFLSKCRERGLNLSNTFVNEFSDYTQLFDKITAKCLHIIYTSKTGWIEVNNEWYYIPLAGTDFFVIDKTKLHSKFKINSERKSTLSNHDALRSTLKLIEVTDRAVSIPLLSYSFLSLFTSFLEYEKRNPSKFSLCIYGNNQFLSGTGFANLFCNFFNRSKYIDSLDATIHSNMDDDIKSKSTLIRDAVFIVNAVTNSKKVNGVKKLLQHNYDSNMMLVLNQEAVNQDFVININIDNLYIDLSLVKEFKNRPFILSTCISDIISDYIPAFYRKGSKKNITKSISKKISEFQQAILKGSDNYDMNKVEGYSCLLFGYFVLISAAQEEEIITEKEADDHMMQATQIFRNECVINLLGTNNVHGTTQVEKHIVFLDNLLELLQISNLPDINDKNNREINNTTNLGWVENGNILRIKDIVFKKIEELLTANGQSIQLAKNKKEIYKNLYSAGVILLKNDDDERIELSKLLIKHIDSNINVASDKGTVVTFRLDKDKALELLKRKQND
ncbi:hypothetical protein SAMN03159341_101457 [Paenibacillus sp. 1_12]|uniref:hypothetical protein n=1 Tax=Paenibacillus sp. 1_12 TaxID=1566278 RepID=UPI0008E90B32|nr:hypothetical protein [Paenibacillus sp. 1_12]SFK76256.1 hypothetical protein SAMN03159341_101457 [Paenibacillus sp. 1_12]